MFCFTCGTRFLIAFSWFIKTAVSEESPFTFFPLLLWPYAYRIVSMSYYSSSMPKLDAHLMNWRNWHSCFPFWLNRYNADLSLFFIFFFCSISTKSLLLNCRVRLLLFFSYEEPCSLWTEPTDFFELWLSYDGTRPTLLASLPSCDLDPIEPRF